MKTTVDIADAVLEEAKRLAERERVSLRAIIEEGLRRLIAERRRRDRFSLRRASFSGAGLDPEIGGWDEVRRRAYEGRGG